MFQNLFWFCYLNEAVTAEAAINSDQEVEKNDPRNAEAFTEEMAITSDQYIAVSALGTAMHPSQRSSFYYWVLSSVQSGEDYIPSIQVTVLLPLIR